MSARGGTDLNMGPKMIEMVPGLGERRAVYPPAHIPAAEATDSAPARGAAIARKFDTATKTTRPARPGPEPSSGKRGRCARSRTVLPRPGSVWPLRGQPAHAPFAGRVLWAGCASQPLTNLNSNFPQQ